MKTMRNGVIIHDSQCVAYTGDHSLFARVPRIRACAGGDVEFDRSRPAVVFVVWWALQVQLAAQYVRRGFTEVGALRHEVAVDIVIDVDLFFVREIWQSELAPKYAGWRFADVDRFRDKVFVNV